MYKGSSELLWNTAFPLPGSAKQSAAPLQPNVKPVLFNHAQSNALDQPQAQ